MRKENGLEECFQDLFEALSVILDHTYIHMLKLFQLFLIAQREKRTKRNNDTNGPEMTKKGEAQRGAGGKGKKRKPKSEMAAREQERTTTLKSTSRVTNYLLNNSRGNISKEA